MAGLFENPNPVASNVLPLEDEKEKTTSMIKSISQVQPQQGVEEESVETSAEEKPVAVVSDAVEVQELPPLASDKGVVKEEVETPVKEVIEEEPLEDTALSDEDIAAWDAATAPDYAPLTEEELRDDQPELPVDKEAEGWARWRAELDIENAYEDYLYESVRDTDITTDEVQAQRDGEHDTRELMAIGQGLLSGFNNTVDAIEAGLNVLGANVEWDPAFELRDDLTKVENRYKIGGEVGLLVGLTFLGGGFLGASRLTAGTLGVLRTAGVPQKAASFMASTVGWMPAEMVAAQLVLKPDQARLVDMIAEQMGLPEDIRDSIKRDPLDSESHKRLMNFAKDAGDSVIGATIFKSATSILKIIGGGLKRSRAAALKGTNYNVAREMSGKGTDPRSQINALEDFLYQRGATLREMTLMRKAHLGGAKVEDLAIKNGTTVKVVTDEALNNQETARRILGRSVIEANQKGMTASKALKESKSLAAIEVRPGVTQLDEVVDGFTSGQLDKLLKQSDRTPQEQMVKNGFWSGVSRKMGLEGKESVISNSWDLHLKPTIGFDATRGMKQFEEMVYGSSSSSQGMVRGLKAGQTGISNRSGALSESLLSTIHTRTLQLLGKGSQYKPTISTSYDNMSGVAREMEDGVSFANIPGRNDITPDTMDDVLSFMQAMNIKTVSTTRVNAAVKPHWMNGTAEHIKNLAKGENRSPGFYNAVEDVRELLVTIARMEHTHGLKSADDLKRMLNSDVVDGINHYFPTEAVRGTAKKSSVKSKGGVPQSAGTMESTGNLSSELLHPVEAIYNRVFRVVRASELNKVKQAHVRELEIMRKSSDPARVELANRVSVRVGGKEWKNDKAFLATVKKELKESIDQGEVALTHTADTPDALLSAYGNLRSLKHGDNTYDVVFFNGKPNLYRVMDPAMQNALKAIGPQVPTTIHPLFNNIVVKPVKALTSLKAKAITYLPSFVAPAQFREFVTSSVFSTQTKVPGKAYLTGIWQGNKMIADALNGGFNVNNTAFSAASRELFKAADLGSGKDKILAEMMGKQANIAVRSHVAYRNTINRLEVSAKLGEISLALKNGMSPQDAAYMGNQMMNFNRKSTSTVVNTAADLMFFLKPSAIGITKMAETMVERPLTAGVYIGGYMGFEMGAAKIRELYPEHDDMSEWAKAINTQLPNLKNGMADMPQLMKALFAGDPSIAPELDPDIPYWNWFGAHELATTGKLTADLVNIGAEFLTDEHTSNDSVQKAIWRFTKATFGVFDPNSADILQLRSLATNKDRWGMPITNSSFSTRKDLTRNYDHNTRPTAVLFSRMLKKLGLNVQPTKLDWGLEWLLPGAGEYVLNVMDAGASEITGVSRLQQKAGGRDRGITPMYLWDSLKARLQVGRAEMNNNRSALFSIQNGLKQIQRAVQTEAGHSAKDLFLNDVLKMTMRVADGSEVLLGAVFPVIRPITKEINDLRDAKLRVTNRTDEFVNYTDQQATDTLSHFDMLQEEFARDAIDYLAAHDLLKDFDFMETYVSGRKTK